MPAGPLTLRAEEARRHPHRDEVGRVHAGAVAAMVVAVLVRAWLLPDPSERR